MIYPNYLRVRFKGTEKRYDYMSFFPVDPGDIVVVQANDTYEIATVTESYLPPNKAKKFVVTMLNLETFKAQLSKYEEQQKILEELEARSTQESKLELYHAMAKNNPCFADLLKRLDSIK